uniref:Beta-1,4-glucuronyltransferase 1 n=2 Tax=Lepisosteus oculatus TaxID=7918 RepID=W5M0K2_LEPOC
GEMHLPKNCSLFKMALGALAAVALLQLLYLSFLSRLHGRQQRYRYSELFGAAARRGARPAQRDAHKERLKFSLATGGIFDGSGQYRVYKNLLQSDFSAGRRPEAPALALATHTSINNLHQLGPLLERWQAPLSVAVFAHGADARLATALAYALSVFCPGVRALVDLHLVCPSGEAASFPAEDRAPFAGLGDCGGVWARLEAQRGRLRNYALGGNVSYPNNLLRNVARGAAEEGAPYVLVADVDMVPSADLPRLFLGLLRRRRPAPREVFVVPAFEIRHARRVPAAKAELLQLYQVGEVRPFYEELCPRCQAPTNYSQWVNWRGRGAGAELEVAYTLAWTDPWEPFYIGARGLPPFDESFRQYGFNRISQACELHVAGYRFSVLSSAFLVHRGFKVAGEFHAQKEEENRQNRVLFRRFKEGLKAKYPSSTRRC